MNTDKVLYNKIRDLIVNNGDVISPTHLMSASLNCSFEQFKDTVVELLNDNIIEMWYRLNVDTVEFNNPWTRDLASLNRIHTLPDGSNVNGGDPTQIVVGFKPKS